MTIERTHSWQVTPREAIAIQQELREQVRLVPLATNIRFIGGCDVSTHRSSAEGYAGYVVLEYPSLHRVAQSVVRDTVPFPYIPGLLSFREIPMLLKAWATLPQKPDVILVDGVGVAHPRRFGIASHLGLELGVATIGCAKNVLTGIYTAPADWVGAFSYLYDRVNTAEVIGAALRTKRHVKPIFISPGHLITLEESVSLVRNCVRRHRLPEPTRLAHQAVNACRIADAEAR